MYSIETTQDYLLVKFFEDFDFNMLHVVMHHLMCMKAYPDTNDIWLIGNHHANIRLAEIEAMVNDFQCHCPKDSTRSKTAVVCERGLTQAVIGLWMDAVQKRVAFEMRMFTTLEEAEDWLGASKVQVA